MSDMVVTVAGVDWVAVGRAVGWHDATLGVLVVAGFVLLLRPTRIRVLPPRERVPFWRRWW